MVPPGAICTVQYGIVVAESKKVNSLHLRCLYSVAYMLIAFLYSAILHS